MGKVMHVDEVIGERKFVEGGRVKGKGVWPT